MCINFDGSPSPDIVPNFCTSYCEPARREFWLRNSFHNLLIFGAKFSDSVGTEAYARAQPS